MKVILNIGRKNKSVTENFDTDKVCNANADSYNLPFYELAMKTVAEERQCRSYSTVNNYLTALRSFAHFTGDRLPISDVTQQLVDRYQQSLKSKGICLNTISCYMRSLHTIYKKIVGKETLQQDNPFATAFMGKTRTRKRSISTDDIIRIQQLKLPAGSYLQLCRDTLLFSFYALGMPFVDIAHLQPSQIVDNTIYYYRQKTMQPIRINIEPCLREIIDRYCDTKSDYVFPFITTTERSAANHQYLISLGRYNRALKRIARMAGVTANITSYTMRHTWATLAFRNNIDLPIISKALGHTNTNTTITYIREIDDAPIAEANHKLLTILQLSK